MQDRGSENLSLPYFEQTDYGAFNLGLTFDNQPATEGNEEQMRRADCASLPTR